MTHEPQDTNSAMVANQENTTNLIDTNETDIVNEGIYADHTNVPSADDIDGDDDTLPSESLAEETTIPAVTKVYDLVYDGMGDRLDVYLSREQGYTRNFFHRLLARDDITVNGEKKKKSYQLRTGDRIHIVHPERYMEASVLAQAPAVPGVKILLEKDDYVVVHKPAGVLAHPNSVRGIEYPSVVGALYQHFKDMPSIGNFIRAGLIHRLDRETDGLMIIVKTERGLKHFQRLFHDKSKASTIEEKQLVPLHKRYRATSYILPEGQRFLDSLGVPRVTIGAKNSNTTPGTIIDNGHYTDLEKDTINGTINTATHKDDQIDIEKTIPEVKLPHIISMVVEPKIPFYEPKLGITKIHTMKYESQQGHWTHKTWDATLEAAKKRHATPHTELTHYKTVTCEMEIFTGRTHQIRYHLSKHGLPIVGDYLYGGDDFYQMQLQAYRLQFQDPDGEMMTVELEPLNP